MFSCFEFLCVPRLGLSLRGLAAAALLSGLAACTGSGGETVSSVGGIIVLDPGGTALCMATPCTVKFRMPAGSGSYEVMSDTMSLGSFPAGETVTLGAFYSAQTFTVKDIDVPPAYFYVR